MSQPIEILIPMCAKWHWEMHPGWWALLYEPRCKEGDEVLFKSQQAVLAHTRVTRIIPPSQEMGLRRLLPWKGLDDQVGRQSVQDFDAWWIIVYEEIKHDAT